MSDAALLEDEINPRQLREIGSSKTYHAPLGYPPAPDSLEVMNSKVPKVSPSHSGFMKVIKKAMANSCLSPWPEYVLLGVTCESKLCPVRECHTKFRN